MEKDISWQTLSSEYLIKRPWLTARRDVVRLPNGVVEDEYYVLEYPDWINVIALTRDGRMILERQYRHALGETSYEIVAGVMEQGESPEEAARRELLEETGYSGGEWTHLMDLSANPSTMTNLCHCSWLWGWSLPAISISTARSTWRCISSSPRRCGRCSSTASSARRSWQLPCGASSMTGTAGSSLPGGKCSPLSASLPCW